MVAHRPQNLSSSLATYKAKTEKLICEYEWQYKPINAILYLNATYTHAPNYITVRWRPNPTIRGQISVNHPNIKTWMNGLSMQILFLFAWPGQLGGLQDFNGIWII
jgi:hypothetical protein